MFTTINGALSLQGESTAPSPMSSAASPSDGADSHPGITITSGFLTVGGASSVSPHPDGAARAGSALGGAEPNSSPGKSATLSPAGKHDGAGGVGGAVGASPALSPHASRSSSAAVGHKRSKSDAGVNALADIEVDRDVVSAMAPMPGTSGGVTCTAGTAPGTGTATKGKSTMGASAAGGAGKKSKGGGAQSQSIRMTAFEMSRRLKNKIKAIESNLGYVRPAVNRKTTFSWRSREIRRHFILHGVGSAAGRPKPLLHGDGDVPRRRTSQNLLAAGAVGGVCIGRAVVHPSRGSIRAWCAWWGIAVTLMAGWPLGKGGSRRSYYTVAAVRLSRPAETRICICRPCAFLCEGWHISVNKYLTARMLTTFRVVRSGDFTQGQPLGGGAGRARAEKGGNLSTQAPTGGAGATVDGGMTAPPHNIPVTPEVGLAPNMHFMGYFCPRCH